MSMSPTLILLTAFGPQGPKAVGRYVLLSDPEEDTALFDKLIEFRLEADIEPQVIDREGIHEVLNAWGHAMKVDEAGRARFFLDCGVTVEEIIGVLLATREEYAVALRNWLGFKADPDNSVELAARDELEKRLQALGPLAELLGNKLRPPMFPLQAALAKVEKRLQMLVHGLEMLTTAPGIVAAAEEFPALFAGYLKENEEAESPDEPEEEPEEEPGEAEEDYEDDAP